MLTEQGAPTDRPLKATASRTFEATPVWGEVLSREFRLAPLQLEGHGHVITVWRHPFYRRCVSTPFRDRIAVSWEGAKPSTAALMQTLAASAMPELVAKDLMWFSQQGGDGVTADAQFFVRFQNADVALDSGLERRIRRTSQQVLRKAQKGVQPLVSEDDDRGLDDFYALYLKTRRRLGVLPYSRNFFRYWYDRIGEDTMVLKCLNEQQPVGYLLCYLHGDEMIPSLIAYDYEHRRMAITDLLHMHAFLWGREHGYRTYRFGGDNLDQDSLVESKLKLGAVPRPQADYIWPNRTPSVELSNPAVRGVLRRTPAFLFGYSSYLTRLYFS